mmetsp:Transcript_35718/g.41653  ORF Transcript_35718/g.41653 Transcript_35718/m.41653 type:complete len:361 (+) Transcript_35718:28-1110(+)
MSFKPLEKTEVTLGLRVQNHNGLVGTIRWIGRLEKKDKPPGDHGSYVGVEFDEPTDSLERNDGVWNGVRHFTCPAGTGEFLKPKFYYREMNTKYVADLRSKYGDAIAHLPDVQLVKFCIARQFNFAKICVMLEKHLAWVKDFKPTEDEFFPPGMCEDYPIGFSGAVDRDNNILYFERPGNAGKCHPADFVSRYGLATIARWHVAQIETGKRLMKESNFKSKRVTCVIDLSNLGDCGTPMVKFAKTIAAIDQDNFPEHLSRLFIVNAPSFFTAIWKLVRFFVDDRTKHKVFILNHKEQKEVLLKYIREEDLPTFVGGTSEAWFKRGGRIGSDDPSHVVADAKVVVEEATDEEIAAAAKAEE